MSSVSLRGTSLRGTSLVVGLALSVLVSAGCGGAAKQTNTGTTGGAESQPSGGAVQPSGAESQPSK